MFYDISTIAGDLMPKPQYIYISIYDLRTHFVDNVFKLTSAHSLHTDKWFHVLLCISNNSFEHFFNTPLKEQTHLFQAIQLNISQLNA